MTLALNASDAAAKELENIWNTIGAKGGESREERFSPECFCDRTVVKACEIPVYRSRPGTIQDDT